MIGVPPYSPGDYLDVDDDGDGTSRSASPTTSARPLRLTPGRGSRAARRRARAARGARLRSRRARSRPRSTKLEDALELPGLVVDVGEPTFLEAIRDAVADARARRDRLLVGRPRRADDAAHRSRSRVLRDGRVVRRARTATAPTTSACSASTASASVAPTGETFEPGVDRLRDRRRVHARAPTTPGSPSSSRPAAAWVAEAYPTESVTERGRRLARDRARGQRAGLARTPARSGSGPTRGSSRPAELAAGRRRRRAAGSSRRVPGRPIELRSRRRPRRPDTRARGRG